MSEFLNDIDKNLTVSYADEPTDTMGFAADLPERVEPIGIFETAARNWEAAVRTDLIEATAAEWVIGKGMGGGEGDRLLTPDEVKVQFPDLDRVDKPMWGAEAAYYSRIKKEKLELEQRAAEAADQGLGYAAVAFGARMIGGIGPTTLAMGKAAAVAGGAVGGLPGAVLGGLGSVGLTRFRAAKAALRAASAIGKQAGRIRRSKVAVTAASVARGAKLDKVANVLRGAMASNVAKTVAFDGGANLIEQIAIHKIDEEKGWKREMTPEIVAMAMFAPVVFKAAAKAMGYAASPAIKKIKSFNIKSRLSEMNAGLTAKAADLQVMAKQAEGNPKAQAGINRQLDDINRALDKVKSEQSKASKVAEVAMVRNTADADLDLATAPMETKLAKLKDMRNVVASVEKDIGGKLDQGWHARIDNISAHIELEKSFGPQVNGYLQNTMADLISSGYRADVPKMYPFLRDADSLKAHIKQLQDKGDLPKDLSTVDAHDMDKLFEVPESHMVKYMENNRAPDHKPTARDLDPGGNKLEPKDAEARFEELKSETEGGNKALAEGREEFKAKVDEYAKCVMGGLDGEG